MLAEALLEGGRLLDEDGRQLGHARAGQAQRRARDAERGDDLAGRAADRHGECAEADLELVGGGGVAIAAHALEKAGIRDEVIVMVGGAPVTQEYADAVGADGYSADASSAVKKAKELIQLKRAGVPA